MPERISFTVNGTLLETRQGATLLEALSEAGAEVPSLCHDPRIHAVSACRLCEVEVAGHERNPCACATPVQAGMVVRTHTPELEKYRKGILELLAREHPADPAGLFKGKPFARWMAHYGVTPQGLRRPELEDRSHPYIHLDMARCIECYRCVHICQEVQGQFVWTVTNRGAASKIVPQAGATLLESSCVSCGACADSCPTGAIADASVGEHGPPALWTRTTCPYCGTGCEMNVGVTDDRIVQVLPVLDSPVSKGHLCVKGRYGTGFVEAPDRVLHPMVRRAGTWVQVSWDEALLEAAKVLRRARDTHGAQALGVLGSSRSTNEESYLVQKLARIALDTNSVDCCARVCHGPSAAGLGLVFGTGAATNGFDDIEAAALILVVGCNPTENHPIVGARIKQRALAGVPLIVIDPRRTELAGYARVHLALRPGTNMPLFCAMARVILDEELEDLAFINHRTEGLDAFCESLSEWTPERAAEICGVAAEDIRCAARLYATTVPAMSLHGLGVTEHIQGTDGVAALAYLAMLTGNVGKAGSGVNPLRGQNNVQGTANMGCEPARLTGYQKIDVARELHEQVWGTRIPEAPGLTLLKMLDAAGEGKLKAMLVFGYDVLLSSANMWEAARALAQLDALVVVDLFMNETARAFGTVFLPAASSFEKEGTFMNAERRIQRVRQAVTPRGESKSDLEIACLLGRSLGFEKDFRFTDAASVWEEIRQVWPVGQGITYERLEQGGIQWPCASVEHPGTRVLHTKTFPVGPRAAFRAMDYRPSEERASEAFPLILNTGRSLYHFNAATMTGRTRNRELGADDWIQMHPKDASRFTFARGDAARIESAHGTFEGRVWITDEVREGELFSTFHRVEALVNQVTGTGRDPVTHTPEFKVTAVRVTRPGTRAGGQGR